MHHLGDIHFRDPFVLTIKDQNIYYLYGTTGKTAWGGKPEGFNVYTSKDLANWEGPFPAFRPNEDFWSDHHYWAPEVHVYHDKYFMFASFKAEDYSRATQILVADSPLGPFVPFGKGPITPETWECLDGTLHIDEEGNPWMIFCHEWLQVQDGEMCAIRLTAELDGAIGEPVVLFKASEAPWVVSVRGEREFVTDGPFLIHIETNELIMMWSSMGKDGYAIGTARSASGNILGPWMQDKEPIFGQDGGHGMLFRTFDGDLLLSIHMPNENPFERPVFLPIIERDGKLEINTLA